MSRIYYYKSLKVAATKRNEKNLLEMGIKFNFEMIYPSQRQNLLPTLEIITHKFQNFQKIQNFGKKIPKSRIFSKISKTTKGPPMTSKGPPMTSKGPPPPY